MAAGRRAAAHLEAYVLHRYDWSESSLILDLFTREQGRVAVAAKGAKRPYSQLRAVLLPFQRIQVTLGRISGDEGASEIQNLRGAEWAGGPAMPSGAALLSGLQAALEHGSLEALRHACARSRAELRAALRGLVHYHLGSSVLRTREVMRDLQNL